MAKGVLISMLFMTLWTIGRRLQIAIIFGILSLLIAYRALESESIATAVCLGWLGANLMALSLAYFMNSPTVFGKTNLGTLHLVVALLMAPLLLVIRLVWILQNAILRPPLYHEIIPNLFVGRLCGYRSLPPDVTLMIDLTAEFPTPRSIRKSIPFFCVPTLDGCPPSKSRVQECVKLIGNDQQRVYVCCANGYGRSVTFMAALLGQLGRCRSAEEAVTLIQASRRDASPSRDQMAILRDLFQSIHQDLE